MEQYNPEMNHLREAFNYFLLLQVALTIYCNFFVSCRLH